MSDPLQVSAADLCELPAMQIEKRPLSDGPTTEITTGILVADITAIDDVSQTITGDFIVMSRWVDPRLEVLNSSQLSSKRMHQKDQVEVEAGGRVSYYQKLYGSIAT